MAVFRSLKVSFWQDEFIIELTPEEKFFYVYLMTNSKSTQCGIFSLSKRLIELETGYNRDTVDKLIDRFVSYGKIIYSEATKEIMIINWIKYNFIDSRNTIACINKELKVVKERAFLEKFYRICKSKDYPIASIFNGIDISEEEEVSEEQGLASGWEGACKELGEKEIEKETEIKKATTNKEEAATAFEEVIDFFNNNIHLISPHESQVLITWSESVENEVVLMAVQEAVEHNVRKLKYINGILNNWLSLGLTSADKIRTYKSESRNTIGKEGKKAVSNASAYEYVD